MFWDRIQENSTNFMIITFEVQCNLRWSLVTALHNCLLTVKIILK